MNSLSRMLLGASLLSGCLGCGGGDRGNPDLRKTAEEAFSSGKAAFVEGQYQHAFEQLETATQGGLNADLYSEALVMHAVSAIHLDKLDEATTDLDILDQGGTNMDEIFAAKSFLALKQGKKAEANRFWQQAVRANPKVKKYSP